MKSFRIILAIVALFSSVNLSAQEFFSTETPEKLFNIGFRVGANISNRTFSKDYFKQWNVDSWGSGFDAGAVVSLNLRDFFSIQPGFFFESRSGSYAYAQDYFDKKGEAEKFTEMGRYRSYYFTVPVMLSMRFNLSGSLKWLVEAGPYAQVRLHSSDNDKITVIEPQESATSPLITEYAKGNNFDFGLKLGSGFMFKDKYSFYIHYLGGGCKAWKAPHEGGRNKSWVFTLGYEL